MKRYWVDIPNLTNGTMELYQPVEMVKYDDIKDSLIVWHDLEENPDDLPERDDRYVLLYRHEGMPILRLYIGDYLSVEKKWLGIPRAVEIIYWTEIKPPKE